MCLICRYRDQIESVGDVYSGGFDIPSDSISNFCKNWFCPLFTDHISQIWYTKYALTCFHVFHIQSQLFKQTISEDMRTFCKASGVKSLNCTPSLPCVYIVTISLLMEFRFSAKQSYIQILNRTNSQLNEKHKGDPYECSVRLRDFETPIVYFEKWTLENIHQNQVKFTRNKSKKH